MNSQEKLDVRLIALDLDDTLLNDNREITDLTVHTLRECAERGIYVVLCSGRAEDAILPFVRRLEIAGKEAGRYLIAINGCSIFDLHKREQIFCRKVEADILTRTNEVAEARGLRSEVYTPDTIYYREETKWTKLDVDLCGLKGAQVEDYDEFLKRGFTKMLVPGEPAELLELQSELRAGEAVSWLANELGFGMEKVMGFGDSMNDESLIRMAGYGVAMCNGLEEMKKAARFVTDLDNNHDGVGDFIKKHVL